jgi:hypothetical protein
MKVNQLGTLAILGVVASFTVACGGGPTKPSAAIPSFGGETSATSVTLTNFQQEVAVDQMCTAKAVTYDDYGNEIPDASTTEAPAAPLVVCDPPAAPDQPQDDVVITDLSSMDSARFSRLHR